MTAKSLLHHFQSAIADGTDTTLVRPSSWNADHDFWLGYRTVTLTTDTIANTDHLSLITYNNGGPIAVSLPAPTTGPPATMPLGWYTRIRNIGAGVVTITGTGGATINGNATQTVKQNETLDLHGTGTNNFIGPLIPSSGGLVIQPNIVVITASGTYTP